MNKTLPLDGVTVLELALLGPIAHCTMMLADMGAEVIKLEIPGSAQRAGLEMELREFWAPLDRNKKSIAISLKREGGREIFHKLVKTVDVIIEGFRPGVTNRLGADYKTVKEINPGIIYCSVSGYGQSGPYSHLPGHDVNYISLGGALGLLGDKDSLPVIPLNFIADAAAANMQAVIGILLALMARDKTGEGQQVDISYLDGVIWLLAGTPALMSYLRDGTPPRRGEMMLNGIYPYYNTYKTKDGEYISIACFEARFWENLCRALDREDFFPYHFRVEHYSKAPEGKGWAEVLSFLRSAFLSKTRDEWFEFLAKKDVCVGKVYSLDEVFKDPQVLAREMITKTQDPNLGEIQQIGIPIKLLGTPGRIRSGWPPFGQHTSEILKELGYAPDDIARSRSQGIVE